MYLSDFLEPDQIDRDSVELVLRGLGLGAQITAVMPMLTGEVVSFTFERRIEGGRHSPKAVAALGGLRPHLARAGLISARLGLERARASVSALEAIGLPAAVLAGSGQVLAANALLEALSPVFRPAAFGGISIADTAADALYRQAIADTRSGNQAGVGSIPIPRLADHAPFVVHVMPVRGAVHDIFSGAQILIAVTTVHLQGAVFPPSVLHGLFDLTPAEARIAAALAAGSPLADAASAGGVTVKTARTYLERIFSKTGTRRQGELVALLKSAGPLNPLSTR
jgi:DNA-binding CsgD family transcriptional regulator